MRYIFEHPDRMLELIQEHVQLVTISVLFAMPFAAARPAMSIGTVLSAVPWMTSVGTRSPRRRA